MLGQSAYRPKSRNAIGVISLTMKESQLSLARSASGAFHPLSRLKDQSILTSLADKLFLRRRFPTAIMKDGDDVLSHMYKLKTLAEQLDK